MSAYKFHTNPFQFVKKLLLLLFFSLGLILMSNHTLKDWLEKNTVDIENTAESEEQGNENERENESEEDDRTEDYLRIQLSSTPFYETFRKPVYTHQEIESMHFGDTFTPPPDQI